MTIFYPDLQIAAGHDNQAGLTRIESITAPGDTRPFTYPRAWYHFNPGQFAIRSDGSFYLRGKAVTAWTFTFLTKLQYQYLSDTYCGGDYDGDVTVKTPLRTDNTNAIINARMRLPKPSETEARLGKVGTQVRIEFANIEILTAGT
jgi:hypothetical protein